MQNVLKVNIMNSGVSNGDVTSDATANADTNTLFSRPPKVVESPDKLDSGIGSECSHRKRHVTKRTRDKTEVQEMECLLTAGGLSLFVYEHSPTGEARTHLVPVIGASLIQPSFSCTRRTDCDTIQISCFDISLAKSRTKTRISGRSPCWFAYSTHKTCSIKPVFPLLHSDFIQCFPSRNLCYRWHSTRAWLGRLWRNLVSYRRWQSRQTYWALTSLRHVYIQTVSDHTR
jgi:hypothetical protein